MLAPVKGYTLDLTQPASIDMNGFVADLRHAIRVYRKTPMASVIAVLALAISMAFVSAFLSLWSDLAIKSHDGFERSEQLVTVGYTGQYGIGGLLEPLVADYHASTVVLQGVAGIDPFYSPTIDWAGEQIPLRAESVTVGYFEALRPRLQLGVGFSAADHRIDAEPVVVISDDMWRRYFDRRPDIVGSQVVLSFNKLVAYPGGPVDAEEQVFEEIAQPYRITGVMSPRMRGTFDREARTDVWLPYERVTPDIAPVGMITSMRSIGRVSDDVTLAGVQAELDTRYPPERAREFNTFGIFQADRLTVVDGIVTSPSMLRDGKRQVGLFLAGTVLLALVAACNASLFLLSRGPTRRRELGIRMSMGATAKRLARQLASEASLLVVTATAIGILVSLWLATLLRELAVFQDVQWRNLSPLDWRVLVALIGLTALLGGLVSLAPMLGFKRQGISAVTRTVTARAGWGQRSAGTVQVCIAAVVSAVAVAFAWQLAIFATADHGFSIDDVSVIRISTLAEQGLGRAEREAIAARRRETIAAFPGVESVSLSNRIPGEELLLTRARPETFLTPELPDGQLWLARIETDAAFVQMLDLELVHGRVFDATDSNPLLVNETLARALWGRTDVVGETFRRADVVVGVLKDVSFGHPAETTPPTYFAPVSTVYSILVRSSYSPNELRTSLQQQIDDGVLEMEIDSVERLETIWNAQFSADRARIQMSSTAAILVVLLAAFGFYGTQKYLVVAGRREYAIRAAIGAGPRRLGRLVLSRGLSLSLPGLVFGSLLAFIAVAWLRDGFVTASVSSLGVTVVVVLAMLALVLSATFGPSLQVRNTAPAPLLREE